jgi:RNA-binding protein YhbY
MRSFIDGNDESHSNGLIQEQLGEIFASKATHTSAPPMIGTEENAKASTYDLERHLNEKEIIKIKVEMSEEIQQPNSAPYAKGILHNAKEDQRRRSKRRNRLRIYIP